MPKNHRGILTWNCHTDNWPRLRHRANSPTAQTDWPVSSPSSLRFPAVAVSDAVGAVAATLRNDRGNHDSNPDRQHYYGRHNWRAIRSCPPATKTKPNNLISFWYQYKREDQTTKKCSLQPAHHWRHENHVSCTLAPTCACVDDVKLLKCVVPASSLYLSLSIISKHVWKLTKGLAAATTHNPRKIRHDTSYLIGSTRARIMQFITLT